MSYQRNTWQRGDTITSAKLNNIEGGLVELEVGIEDSRVDLEAGFKEAVNELGSAVAVGIAGAYAAVQTAIPVRKGAGKNAAVEGAGTTASGTAAHAEGNATVANHRAQHVFGEYNIADASGATAASRGTYVEIVGNGAADNARSNARTLDWNGNEALAGSLTIGTGTEDEVTVTPAQLRALLALLPG